MRSPLVARHHDHVNQKPTLTVAPTAPGGTGSRLGRLAIATMAGLLTAGLLATAPDARATEGGHTGADIAVVAALDGAPVPLPASKPIPASAVLTTADGVIPLPPPVPPQRLGAATITTAALITDTRSTPALPTPAPARSTANGAPDEAVDVRTPAPVEIAARVDKGDTLMGLLIDAGVDRISAHNAIQAMEDVYDPRHMRPGYVVNIRFAEPDEDALQFLGFDFEPTTGTRVSVIPKDDTDTGFAAQEVQEALVGEVVRFGGPITLSLYQAAIDAGVSEHALADMIHVLSYDVDFQRDIQKDDTFEVMYERFSTADGRYVRDGEVQFVALTNAGRRITAYAYEHDDGVVDYFDEAGRGVRKPLMRTPIDGARISSSFGMRRHPILGYSKMHTGVDFAAPTGTPIYAAGDGVVHYAGRKGGYGKYVQVRHNAEFSTAYAHMSRIEVENGQRVKQGDIIGRVGATGRVTGPHLHYEIIRGGQKVNPLDVRFPPAIALAGADLRRFQAHRAEVDRLYASLRASTEIASTGVPSP
ncbi:peptidoglycan DD-metalloendopeptidase family protein [Roseospira marina]|uniref:Peptidoglycan DD-metalloendopeptidase family protein n=1 Tax=Roseospira marina TaxID=140057 RepID=A0A5M6I659_9PROT|nr:peptidoglycan DD-metalloendopeptidase family protein [Roseospira marina]KAA5603730.1 peptidoglycan DD-metalloendopeptidase family protein [Roseospira marina]MBB4316110.1 murein DD-endopeptidase MepM/ murein hydrolase activator NlpD [Roseospira marina]MBB5089308.1 murein DD-endopeptidase MepM/ murein hydrolase activator NlpD [Roseospira marina]